MKSLLAISRGTVTVPLLIWGIFADDVVSFETRIVISTTSDWTTVEPQNFFPAIVGSNRLTENKFKYDGFHFATGEMSKSRKAVEYKVSIRISAVEKELKFLVSKGDIGVTTVMVEDQSVLNEKVDGTGQNRAECSIELSKLAGYAGAKKVAVPNFGKKVLAFYYPWYGCPEGPTKRWVHWDPNAKNYSSTNKPKLGWYDSHDPKTVRQHIKWAKESGIDGFICSWWGKGTFEDCALPTILEEAEKESFSISVYYEQADSVKRMTDDFSYIVENYSKSKSWLKVGESPVIFVYSRVIGDFSALQFEKALEPMKAKPFLVCDGFNPAFGTAFSGFHTYNPVGNDALLKDYSRLSKMFHSGGFLFCSTVLPGYDDRNVRKGFAVSRDDGNYYKKWWNAAQESNCDWVLVCSFNEWHEGSEIEPSVENGDKFLQITKEYSAKFKN